MSVFTVEIVINLRLAEELEYDKKPTEYWYISQAETTIKGVNDKEEFAMTDVCV